MSIEIEAVRRFRDLSVLVVGDAMLDSYYLGSATRLSPEGPVPVVKGTACRHLPGGAANTAANVASLGAQVRLLAVVGEDHQGEILRNELARRGVDVTALMVSRDRPTTTKLRILADERFMARFDQEEDSDLDRETESRLIEAFSRLFQQSDVVIVSDYTKGVVTSGFVASLGSLNRNQGKLVVVDSKDLPRRSFRNVSVVTPNHLEAQRACRAFLGPSAIDADPRDLEQLGNLLLEQIGTRWVMMTLGADGVLLFEREKRPERILPRRVRAGDPVGAGDTFTAALALGLGARLGIGSAARVAVEAAGMAVGKPLTATVTQQELLQRLSLREGLDGRESLSERMEEYRVLGKRIVFTNGAFDCLHSGHVAFLREARSLGDLLVVGVNSDESLRRSTGRYPLIPEEERLSLIAALDPVDHAVLFDEDEPSNLIREVRPHLHVKGGDYREVDLPEREAVREVGGEVVILPLVEQRSSRGRKLVRPARRGARVQTG